MAGPSVAEAQRHHIYLPLGWMIQSTNIVYQENLGQVNLSDWPDKGK